MNLAEKAEVRRETFYKLTSEGALGNLVVESKLSKGWLNANGNGQILGPDAKGERTTDFIQVVAGKTYTFQWWATVSEDQKGWDAWQFYDSNRNPFGSRGGYGEYSSDGEQHGKRTITAPANACYIRLSYRSFGNGHMMFEAGTGSESFEPSFEDSLKKSNRNIMQRTDKPFAMGYGITNTTWDDDKKWAYLDLTDPNNNPAKASEILPQGQFWNFKPIKGMTYTQSILIDTDATFNPNGQVQNSWFTNQGHNQQKGYFEQLGNTTYRFWSTCTWQLEDIALRAFDWYDLYTVLNFRNSGTYLAFYKPKLETSEQPSEWVLAPEDLGWSTATQVPTQQQRYLWKFEYVYYSDGSVEVTQPVNLSIAGADGTNGQTSHVHFAFADNATGGGFSLTTPKAYMGWYADFNETASNDPTKYRWGKWKGDQGAPGIKGDDGKTSYLHLAFASSADGKTGFSFTESGQQYQGYYTDFTQTSSTDPTKYTWMDRRAGVEVGGVNLLHNSQGPFKPNKDNPYKHDNYIVYPKVTAYLEEGKQYIVTAKTDGAFSNNHVNVESDNIILWMVKANGSVNQIISDTKTGEAGTVFIWNHPTGEYCLRVNAYHDEPDKSAWEVKIEEGNIKTTYTRNPEDVQSDIDSKADQALTQEQLNALAEQNNIVKAEMEAKASIDTVNQWITAYQNYVAANDEARAESEKNLQEAAARILQLKTDVGALRQQWDFIDTYMSIQNEGLIIGKSDGSAFAKFANDRISLFSGSSEVMYISQGTLHIENGIFTKTIQIGRFRFETHPADADMLVLRYLGG